MNKSIILTISVVLLSFSVLESAMAKWVDGDINIGNPSKNCDGIGFCGANLQLGQNSWSWGITRGAEEKTVKMQTYIEENKNIYVITFSAGELKKKNPEKTKEFEKGKFHLEEDVILPKEVREAYNLQRSSQVTLKKGVYDIQVKGDVATVEIDVK